METGGNMYFCIAGLLEDDSQNEIRKKVVETLRHHRVGVTALLLPQHISLKISFATEKVDDLVSYFDELCLNHLPIQVALQNLEAVAIDEPGLKTGLLWYNVSDDGSLRKIHNQLNKDLPQRLGISNSSIDGERFRFHSTIAYGQKSFEEYRKIYNAVAEDFREISARIDRLALFCCMQDKIAAGQFFTLRIGNLAMSGHD
jgi:2'-5' RNA ligase